MPCHDLVNNIKYVNNFAVWRFFTIFDPRIHLLTKNKIRYGK